MDFISFYKNNILEWSKKIFRHIYLCSDAQGFKIELFRYGLYGLKIEKWVVGFGDFEQRPKYFFV